jgi:hypothetical protein
MALECKSQTKRDTQAAVRAPVLVEVVGRDYALSFQCFRPRGLLFPRIIEAVACE